MRLNKLPSESANALFESLEKVSVSKTSLKEKFSNKKDRFKDSLKAILWSTIYDVYKESGISTAKKPGYLLLQDIVNFSSLGSALSSEILKVYNRIIAVAYDKKSNTPNDDFVVDRSTYLASLGTISEFIAVLSGLPVPETLRDIINGIIPLGEDVVLDARPKEDDDSEPTANDLIINPTTRVPVVLCLDVSSSMLIDNRIEQLNQGVQEFFNSVIEDRIARSAAEICIVTFGSEVKQLIDFNYAEKQKTKFESVRLEAKGNTSMGAAVELSLDLLEKRKQKYTKYGVDYWQPWLVLMTDGQATDNIDNAVARCSDLVEQRKLFIFPVALGKGANIKQLKLFSPKRAPMRLDEQKMSEFFIWLSQSVRTTSLSSPGDEVNLPDIKTWAVL